MIMCTSFPLWSYDLACGQMTKCYASIGTSSTSHATAKEQRG